jgi:cell division protease FtsH
VPIDPGRGPIVIATSNRWAQSLDAALVRPGRLGISIVFATPDARERMDLLAAYLRGRTTDPIDLRYLAELTRDWTPAALRAAVDEADGYALARGGPTEPVTEADCVLAVRRGSVREREPAAEDADAAGRWRSAVHEAGHAVVAVRLGQPIASIRLATSGLGGHLESGAEGAVRDDAAMRASVVISMGGIAAERLLLGEPSAGSRDDVRNATRTLLLRIEAGLDPDFPPVERAALGDYGNPALDQLLVDRILPALDAARGQAAAIVLSERDGLERLARILVERPVLAGHHLVRALGEAGLRATTDTLEADHAPA